MRFGRYEVSPLGVIRRARVTPEIADDFDPPSAVLRPDAPITREEFVIGQLDMDGNIVPIYTQSVGTLEQAKNRLEGMRLASNYADWAEDAFIIKRTVTDWEFAE